MAEVMFAMPVLPGKTDIAREMFRTASGPRRSEAEAENKRHGIKKDTWFLQSSPQGDLILGYLETDDPQKALTAYATDQDSFTVWSREKFKEITGIDMSQPQAAPPPEQLWRHGY